MTNKKTSDFRIVRTKLTPLAPWAILYGGISSLAFVPFFIAPVFAIAFCLFIKLLLDRGYFILKGKRKDIVWYGFLFFFSQNFFTLSWVYHAPQVFDDSLVYYGYLLGVGLPLLMASFSLPWWWLASRFYGSVAIILLMVGLAMNDLLRDSLLSGFPWNIASHSFLYSFPFQPALAYVGQYVLSAWFYILLAFIMVIYYRQKMIGIHATLLPLFMLLWFALPFFTPPVIHSFFANKSPPLSSLLSTINHQPDVQIIIIQPNIDIVERNNNWADNIIALKEVSRNYSEEFSGRPTIVIWPESILPLNSPDLQSFITDFLTPEQYLITGAIRQGQKNNINGWFNSLFVLNHQGEVVAVYDKHHLVPFGEYIPFAEVAKKWGFLPVAAQDINLLAGAEPVPITLSFRGRDFTILPLICYEVAFPHLVFYPDKNIDAIVNVTNDAWFDYHVGPQQHLFMAQLRAIEHNRPLYRSALDGISAVIDAEGRVAEEIAMQQKGAIIFSAPFNNNERGFYAAHQRTIYQGLRLFLLSVLSILVTVGLWQRMMNHD